MTFLPLYNRMHFSINIYRFVLLQFASHVSKNTDYRETPGYKSITIVITFI